MLQKIRYKLKKVLQLDYTPKQIALAAAIGMFLGVSPYLGFHTALALGASFVFSLPLYPIVLAAYVTNPFTIVPIYTVCYKIGALLTGEHAAAPPSFSGMTMQTMLHTAKTFFVPFFVGTHVVGLILAVITYILTYRLIKKYKSRV